MIFTSSCCDNLSIDEIIERAEKGDCEAQYIVGFYYNRDSAIDSPDDEKAFYWLKLAAEQGHCEAQYSLGQKYTEDKSCPTRPYFRFQRPWLDTGSWRRPQL